MTLPPIQQAREDCRKGEGHDHNPFSKEADYESWYAYAMELHRLQKQELDELRTVV